MQTTKTSEEVYLDIACFNFDVKLFFRVLTSKHYPSVETNYGQTIKIRLFRTRYGT